MPGTLADVFSLLLLQQPAPPPAAACRLCTVSALDSDPAAPHPICPAGACAAVGSSSCPGPGALAQSASCLLQHVRRF
jgi:hypothetical protein